MQWTTKLYCFLLFYHYLETIYLFYICILEVLCNGSLLYIFPRNHIHIALRAWNWLQWEYEHYRGQHQQKPQSRAPPTPLPIGFPISLIFFNQFSITDLTWFWKVPGVFRRVKTMFIHTQTQTQFREEYQHFSFICFINIL